MKSRSRFKQFLSLRSGLVRTSLVLSALLILSTGAFAQGNTDDQEDAVAVFNQGQDAHQKGNLPEAIALYKKALKIVPEFPEAEYQCGIAYLVQGNVADAERCFRRAVELRSDWTLALTSLGSLLVQNRNYTEAEVILKKAISLDGQNFPAYAALVELRLKTRAPEAELRELLDKIVPLTAKANPTSSVWSARAALESALGKRDAAKLSLANALSIDPKNRYAIAEAAEIALIEGDNVRADESVTTLEKIAPDADATKVLRARVLASDGKLAEALKTLDSLGHTTAEAAELRARIDALVSENAPDLEKRLDKDPNNVTVLGRLCALYRVNSPEKALDYCRRASSAEPNNINHAIGYGAALVQAKSFAQAVGLFRKLLVLAPDNSTAHANLATALFQLKRFEEAKTEYQWLIAKQPDLAVAYYLLGITHDQLAEYMNAMANYQQFLRLADPAKNQLEIDKVKLRLPILQRQIKESKGKKGK